MSLDINIDDLSIDEKKEILSVDNLTLMSIEEGYQKTVENITHVDDKDEYIQFLYEVKESLKKDINIQSNTSHIQTYDITHQKGILNPHKEFIIERDINIDSQYRKDMYHTLRCQDAPTTTNFTVELSETITNVISMSLQTVNIPCTWYNIDKYTGLGLVYDDSYCEISEGYYNITTLLSAINTAINTALNTDDDDIFTYDTITSKVSYKSTGTLYFYKSDNTHFEYCTPTSNLGYTLGWRNIQEDDDNNVILNSKAIADSIYQLNVPSKCVFLLDDMNHNHSNHTMIGSNIRQDGTSYPHYRQGCESLSNNIYYNTIPKSRTQSQIYSLNQISIGKRKLNLQRQQPIHSDVFAIFPLQYTQDKNMSLTGGAIQNNRRTYFGPVNIEKLKIILMDDRGKELNLNGTNWSFTIKVKQIYQ